jgi:integral membrane protein
MAKNDTTSTNRIIRALGTTATVEAFTWAGLLVGMLFKRVLDLTELGVQVFGPLHGAAFIAYCVTAVLAWRSQQWTGATGLVALLASLPPFGTVVFHRWAVRSGRLQSVVAAPGDAGSHFPAGGSLAPTAEMPLLAEPAASSPPVD